VSRLVVKVGGAVADRSAERVLELAREHEVCVVHGAGPQISVEMERAGIPVEFVDGRRVTSQAGLMIVYASLEAVNEALCAAIGARAVPFFGSEVGLEAARIEELGLVGEAMPQDVPAVERVLRAGKIPVLAPTALDESAKVPLNVNADNIAAAVAVGMQADELLFLMDVEGLIVDGEIADSIDHASGVSLLSSGVLEGGIIPKLTAALEAARWGVPAFIGRTGIVPQNQSAGVPLTRVERVTR
jgi:acetylglutamate kinase